ncbi:MAG: hypothetical protein JXA71_17670 [Chitinispirillaceae bacterium]|nr:hypothetical protein [Chitinispirillaceae bacterium]
MKSARLHILATAAVLVLLGGMFYTAPAGQRVHRPITRDAEVTTIPAPVVDDTPINPDTAGKIKPRGNRGNASLPDNQQPKRRSNRR